MLIRLPFLSRRRVSSSRRHRMTSTVQIALEKLETRILPAAFTVTTTSDSVDLFAGNGSALDANGTVSLRSAIQEANALAGPDLIILPAGTFTLSISGANEDNGATGDLDVTSQLTILGAGADRTIIDGAQLDRVLHVSRIGNLQLSGVTIRNGAALFAGGILNAGTLHLADCVIENNSVSGATNSVAGGIGNAQGTLNMTRVIVRGNSAEINGGGLYSSSGVVTMTDSTITNNTAINDGGGLSIFNGSLTMTGGVIQQNTAGNNGGGLSTENATITLTDATINSNASTYNGGGINAIGNTTLTVVTSEVSDNTAGGYGGGIQNLQSTLSIQGSTISGNQATLSGGGLDNDTGIADIKASLIIGNSTAGDGGGIDNFSSTLGITNSTITGNQAAGTGGGIFNTQSSVATIGNVTITANGSTGVGGGIINLATLNIANTIIALNAGASGSRDIAGAFSTFGNNLIGQLDGGTGFSNGVNGDLVGTAASPLDPKLGTLADNGGPTLSFALLTGSPAIDAGHNSGVTQYDQTGAARIFDGDWDSVALADIGSIEYVSDPPTFTVNSTADTLDRNPGDGLAVDRNGNITLRSAIQEANALSGANEIKLPAGYYRLSRAGSGEDVSSSGDLDITENLKISGAGIGQTTIDANQIDRIFEVFSGVTLILTGLTIENGSALYGGAILANGATLILQDVLIQGSTATGTTNSDGGAIAADQSTLTLTRVTLSGNTADVDGGGIYTNNSILTMTDSTINGNTASRTGGGLAIEKTTGTFTNTGISGNAAADKGGGAAIGLNSIVSFDTVLISENTAVSFGGGMYVINSQVAMLDSTIRDNISQASGGGLNNEQGSIQITGSTISGNTAYDGGGIDNYKGTIGLVQTTISGNTATGNGGGIVSFAGSTTDLRSSTIANNTAAGYGGGVWTEGLVRVGNSIIATNNATLSSPDFAGTALSLGMNIIGIKQGMSGISGGSGGNIVGTRSAPVDPVLSPLADHGGPTWTQIPLAGSPAIDAGIDLPGITTDQRGRSRNRDGNLDGVYRSDIGAAEYFGVTFTLPSNATTTVIRQGDVVLISETLAGDITPLAIYAVPFSDNDQIVLSGSVAADTVIVDVAGGNPVPIGGLKVVDTTVLDEDILQLTGGTLDQLTYDFANARYLFGDRPFETSGFETVSDQILATTRILSFTESADSIQLQDNGVTGDSRMQVINTDGSSVDFPIPLSSLIVELGTGNDVATLASVDSNLTQSITVRGGADNDFLSGNLLLKAVTLDGGDGDDTLIGGNGSDSLSGDAGTDSLTGNGGNDTLSGGSEADIILGGAGDDSLLGNSGLDTLTGGTGNDSIDGGTSQDLLIESGDVNFVLTDSVMSGLGTDAINSIEQAQITGGSSNNRINAGGFSGRTTLDGSLGNDTLIGGSGRDLLTDLSGGNDSLDGGGGNDVLNAGPGSDSLTGGTGNDTLTGSAGRDFVIEQGNTDFTLTSVQLGGKGLDRLSSIEAAILTGGAGDNGINATAFSGMVTLSGGAGNDTLLGGSSADVLLGGDGDDSLRGGSGNDSVSGDTGNDTLIGDDGDDTLDGGDGNDGLSGRVGNDWLSGQSGSDTMLGDAGNDTLQGGGGADTLIGGDGNDNVSGNSGTDKIVGGQGGGSGKQAGDVLVATAGEIDDSFSFYAGWAAL